MNHNFIESFRHAAPYINQHRNHTFVLALSGAAIASENFKNIVNDVAVLNSLGIRIILINGFRQQIDNALKERKIESQFHKGLRVTDKETLDLIQQIAGQSRIQIEAAFTLGINSSPLRGKPLKLCSGNFVTAKPMGVLDGIDMQLTGTVRNIDTETIQNNLDQNQIILLSTLAYSATAEVFNLSLHELAVATAKAVNADKLIVFQKEEGLLNENGFLIRQINTQTNNEQHIQPSQQALYESARDLVANNISRAHILSYEQNGALLQELFTHLGAGTLISKEDYELVRQATSKDINCVIELIEPFEEKGILVKRSRSLLEEEISKFTLIECDNRVIACAALYPYETSAEIACIVTHPEYQGKGLASRMLDILENKARDQNLQQVFVLSTQTTHWFIEHGFVESSVDALPQSKKELYNFSRNSKVLIKTL